MRSARTILLFLVVSALVLGCAGRTDENKIKTLLTDIQTAGEEKNIKKMMNHLSKTYSDPQGFNYDGIHGLLVGYFFRYPKISVYINNLTVSVEKAQARAVFQTVLVSGEKTGSITDAIPQSLGIWNFDVLLKKEPDGWKVVSAKWEQVEMMKPGES
ncbi:MAG: hypothetical protein EG826_00305 [Deltaproteobacteria bacterium]|nr:hypothetical protein [Deltaproteobacteria bacterium]